MFAIDLVEVPRSLFNGTLPRLRHVHLEDWVFVPFRNLVHLKIAQDEDVPPAAFGSLLDVLTHKSSSLERLVLHGLLSGWSVTGRTPPGRHAQLPHLSYVRLSSASTVCYSCFLDALDLAPKYTCRYTYGA